MTVKKLHFSSIYSIEHQFNMFSLWFPSYSKVQLPKIEISFIFVASQANKSRVTYIEIKKHSPFTRFNLLMQM